MKIIVCIKQVPDTSEVKLDPKTNTLIRDGVPSIINPDDKSGIEAALKIKEQVGGTVTVVCMGPPQADVAIREALAMGCDDGVLISGREFGGSDTLATSTIIAAGLKTLDYDLIITGRQAIDGDTAQVGPQIAEHLGLPQVSYAEDIQVESENSLIVKRQYEDRYQKVRIKTPCVITALTELAEPRYMSVGGTVALTLKKLRFLALKISKINLTLNISVLKVHPQTLFSHLQNRLKALVQFLKTFQLTKLLRLSSLNLKRNILFDEG